MENRSIMAFGMFFLAGLAVFPLLRAWRRFGRAVGGLLAALAILALLIVAALALGYDRAGAEALEPECTCADGNVKWEAPGRYAYSDGSGSITVSGDYMRVTWTPAPGYVVTRVCVKIGGPGGGTTVNPAVNVQPWVSERYAVSHVVLWTSKAPTAVSVRGLAAAATSPWALVSAVAVGTAALYALAWAIIARRFARA